MVSTAIMDHTMEHTMDIMMVVFFSHLYHVISIVTDNMHQVKFIMNDSWIWLNSFHFCPEEPLEEPHLWPPNIGHHAIIIKNPKGHLGHHGFAGYGAPTPFVGNGFRLTFFLIFCFEKMMYEKMKNGIFYVIIRSIRRYGFGHGFGHIGHSSFAPLWCCSLARRSFWFIGHYLSYLCISKCQ